MLDESIPPNKLRRFSLKGRSLRNVLRASIDYLEQTAIPYENYSWQALGWDYRFEDEFYSDWEIIELTSGKELFFESQRMSHCVSSYAGRCLAGISAIFSLRKSDRSIITIELTPKLNKVVQARGVNNRDASNEEKVLIEKWLEFVRAKSVQS